MCEALLSGHKLHLLSPKEREEYILVSRPVSEDLLEIIDGLINYLIIFGGVYQEKVDGKCMYVICDSNAKRAGGFLAMDDPENEDLLLIDQSGKSFKMDQICDLFRQRIMSEWGSIGFYQIMTLMILCGPYWKPN